ncbi:hypothetical protein HFO56_24365 [Rhizobium laguerreae]|uniref:hypothetical protein n=1 Tax=Rhizobium laguerreae TaxID=1076926 RepID=UPI001C922C23|nr:hypothetical protein [Rhizobium laguerreae]MBY3155465.1 hypothetical protein [Rhizobium laguerreae]
MKIQIAFRETRERRAEHDLWIAAGLVEADETFAAGAEEKFVSVRMDFTQDGTPILALFTRNTYQATYDGRPLDREELKTHSLESMVTKNIDRIVPGPFSNAELFLRRTNADGSAGKAVLAFSGLVGYKPPIRLDCDSVFQLGSNADGSEPDALLQYQGRVGTDINPSWGHPAMIEATAGHASSAFLRTPVWGFGDEPIRLGSTMHLDMQAKVSRHRALHFSDRTPAEEAEYVKLSVIMSREGLNEFGRSPDFEEAMRKLLDAGFPAAEERPLTRKEFAARSDYMSDIVRDLVARQRMAEMSNLSSQLKA